MAWTRFPYPDPFYVHTPASLKRAWPRLHLGDAEPYPREDDAIAAWIAFHAGEFEKAAKLGLACGAAGLACANKATSIYANYLEKSMPKKLALFEEVAQRCEEQQRAAPREAAAWYWHAYSLGRYAQGISVVKALAQGIGQKVKASLDKTVALAPKHADAQIALGTYNAEIIDKVGAVLGRLTYGASKEDAYRHFQKALQLNPDSAIARIEYANALAMLDKHKRMDEAERLYREAAAAQPHDAMERLDVELAKAETEEE